MIFPPSPEADRAIALAKQMLSQPTVKDPLSWFITDAPLYSVVTVNWPVPSNVAVEHLPDKVAMPCDHCQTEVTNWDRASGGWGMSGQLHNARYECRNCKESSVTIYYSCQTDGAKTHFVKVGRVPKFEINPPKELGKALGQHRALYIKGKTLRHQNYGLGALLYFRRLIEETTDELLDLLEEVVKELGSGQEGALATINHARKGQRFEDKVKVAADAMPPHLRPGGINPLGLLYELVSYDIHEGTDEEAIEIVDEMDKTLEFLFTELKAHAQDRKAFTEGINRLAAQRQERQSKKKSE